MRCTRVEKFLPLHVAGDLKGRRASQVVNHLATCARCRAVAEEFDASRHLVRGAATLPPEFDGAFYEEIRRSVLDEIRRTRTLAPPPSIRLASLFNARFAYAASLALLVAAVAALSLHSYLGQKSQDGAGDNRLADTKRERVEKSTATVTPTSVQTKEDRRQTLSPINETARESARHGAQVAESSSTRRRVRNGNARNETPLKNVEAAKHAPSRAKLNERARIVVAAVLEPASAGETATGSDEMHAATEVSRIEIQTSDPNIRIIWLSPRPDDIAQPLK